MFRPIRVDHTASEILYPLKAVFAQEKADGDFIESLRNIIQTYGYQIKIRQSYKGALRCSGC